MNELFTGKEKNRYFFEYAYAQAIDLLNRNGMGITARKAKLFRKNMIQEIKENIPKEKEYFEVSKKKMVALMNKHISGLSDEKSDNYIDEVFMDATLSDFKNLTGFIGKTNNDGKTANQRYLPVSPFDDKFANRKTFLDAGVTLLYVSADDIEKYGTDCLDAKKVTKGYETKVYRVMQDNKGNPRYTDFGKVLTDDDVSGMSRIAPYMNGQKNYEILKQYVVDMGLVDESRYMSPEGLDMACGILDYLQDNGIEYEIKKDSQVGQLVANLTGTSLNVRIMNAREDEGFIGRVYDNGLVYYFGTLVRNGTNGYYNANDLDLSLEDRIDLIRFARGEAVQRKDKPEKKVGEIDRSFGKKSGKVFEYNQTIVNNKSFSSNYRIAEELNTKYGTVTMRVKNTRKALGDVRYSKDDAIEYVNNAYQSAVENYVNKVNLEELLNMDDVEYSSNDDIQTVQQYYYEMLEEKSKEEILERFKQDLTEKAGVIDNGEYRINPAFVATYMTSLDEPNINLISLENMFNKIGRKQSKNFIGDEYLNTLIRDNLTPFNEVNAIKMSEFDAENEVSNEFISTCYQRIIDGLDTMGCEYDENDILIDDNGLITYKVKRPYKRDARDANGELILKETTGMIGPLFIPDERGLVTTKFAGSENYMFSPGYEAFIVPNKDGENKSVEERTKLVGYEQKMADRISYVLRNDLVSDDEFVGSSHNLSKVYRGLYDTRYELDYFDKAKTVGMDDSLLDSIIRTNARRVRYSNTIKKEATLHAEYQYNMKASYDPNFVYNDNYNTPYQLCGRNMSIMPESGDGYFDPIATSTATNQGIVRYLTEDCKVNADGFMTRGKLDGRTPLMNHEYMKYSKFNPFDRQQMTFNNLLTATAVIPKVKVAMMAFRGWNFDDGFPVSKKFAERCKMYGVDLEDQVRNLMIGDKISDFSGNKGVITKIIDPDMSDEEAQKQNLEQEVAWFRANPELEVIASPYSFLSRFNGGTMREAMEHSHDLISPDGEVFEGSIGEVNLIQTDMNVDVKTHLYDDESIKEGKGRKASAQLAWALAGLDAKNLMREYYYGNDKGVRNLRERLIVLGMDMDEVGNLRMGYKPHEGEETRIVPFPEKIYKDVKDKETGEMKPVLDTKAMMLEFADSIGDQGGFLEIPFNINHLYSDDYEDIGLPQNENGMYMLPLLSSHLRSSQTIEDGTVVSHSYTQAYKKIFKAVLDYEVANELNDSIKKMDAVLNAQSAYNEICSTMITREFENKNNIYKEELMGHRLSNSATMVASADPRLKVNQISMSSKTAETLKSKEGDIISIWRDPILRVKGTRAAEIVIDEEITGFGMHPAAAKSFEGDFDGDAYGGTKAKTKSAMYDLKSKLSFESNLLDLGSLKNDKGLYDLFINKGLELKSVESKNEELKKKREYLTERANEVYQKELQEGVSKETIQEKKQILNGVTKYLDYAFYRAVGIDIVSFKDIESHLKSLEPFIKSGAKGSYDKLGNYAKNLGVKYQSEFDGTDKVGIKYDTLEVNDTTFATRDDLNKVQRATAIKTFATGIAGAYSQRAMKCLRNYCPKEALECTYVATQAVLDAKHDPYEAEQKYNVLMTSARNLWRGYKLEKTIKDGKVTWSHGIDPKTGEIAKATKEEWIEQYNDIYNSKDGLNVSVDKHNIEAVANALVGSDGFMCNIEKDFEADHAAPLDSLAYGGGFDKLLEFAQTRRNLFEGEYNECFKPKCIVQNEQSLMNGGEMHVIKAKDTIKKVEIAVEKQAPVIQHVVEESMPQHDGYDDDFSM